MYMNRLRHDDFIALFESLGHEIVLVINDVDERSLDALSDGWISVDRQFENKPDDVLATVGSWILSRKNEPMNSRNHFRAAFDSTGI